MIFVNLPVADLPKSMAFYSALGFTNNPAFTDETAACMVWGGGTILVEPMEIPGGEFSLNVMDPQGAAFGLVGPRVA
jgi:predicted enzyme related to lactoylglutathione lyase